MQAVPIDVIRRPEKLLSDDHRVITRYLDFGNPKRIRSILRRLVRIGDRDVPGLLEETMADFSVRHRDLESAFMENYRRVRPLLKNGDGMSRDHQLLIGAYFMQEYSIESAALFNPSIVMDPDQSDLPSGSVRFLLSLRATGEGHVSSIVFRRGMINAQGDIIFDPAPRYAHRTRPMPDKKLEKSWYVRKLTEMGVCEGFALRVLATLPDRFDAEELREKITHVKNALERPSAIRGLAADMLWLAQANYELRFPEDCHPSEIVLFPATKSERRGMEDLRLTLFVDEEGLVSYFGTYTAFGASHTLPMLLRTSDFVNFRVRTMGGRHVKNKGMALFPRKIDGKYMMISRHDGENLWLLESQNVYSWNNARRLQVPRELWELVQLGNCGSPIETDAGWILLTHGVGPVRRYCIGAVLLDLDDPSRVIGRLRQPLIIPTDAEREGYVPNVVYSCGSMIHNDRLIIPYAMSDQASGFATVSVAELVDLLLKQGP